MSEKKQPKKADEEKCDHDHKHEQGLGKINIETAKKIQELQMVEQNIQNIVIQKQTFQMELNEILNALSELQNSKGETYKIVGSIMINSDKTALEKDLKSKEEALNLRIKNMEKQENILRDKLLKTREEVMQELG